MCFHASFKTNKISYKRLKGYDIFLKINRETVKEHAQNRDLSDYTTKRYKTFINREKVEVTFLPNVEGEIVHLRSSSHFIIMIY